MAKERRLTERQKTFCKACAEGKSPQMAAQLAGYRNIGRTVQEMYPMEKIQKEICRQQEKDKLSLPQTEPEAVAEKEEILRFLTEMMRAEDDPKMRMKAAELLGKRVCLFEKETAGADQSPILIVDDLP